MSFAAQRLNFIAQLGNEASELLCYYNHCGFESRVINMGVLNMVELNIGELNISVDMSMDMSIDMSVNMGMSIKALWRVA